MELTEILGPNYGLFPKSIYVNVWNRSGGARAIGDCMMFDLASVETETTETLVLGAEASPLANATLPTTLGLGGLSGASLDTGNRIGYFFGFVSNLLADAGADNKPLRLQVMGIGSASVAAVTTKPGYPLFPANGVATITTTLAAGNKCVAVARATYGGSAGVFSVLIDGINGFGCPVAS